jgi:hypothetical protein
MGFQNPKARRTGNFVIVITIKVPAVGDENIKNKLLEIRDELNNISK